MSEPELERLEMELEREALYFQYHEDIAKMQRTWKNSRKSATVSWKMNPFISGKYRNVSGMSMGKENGSVEIPPVNFHITDDQLGYGTAKEKFRANVMAIQVLKKCERENRYTSPEEQEILSNYVGWGRLPDAFDESKASWSEEYQELKDCLPKRSMRRQGNPR